MHAVILLNMIIGDAVKKFRFFNVLILLHKNGVLCDTVRVYVSYLQDD